MSLRSGPGNVVAGVLVLLTLACRQEKGPSGSATVEPAGRREFFVKGAVREVRQESAQVVIRHEAIPDYMEAMTMPFEVKDTNELDGLQAGDEVVFRLLVTDEEGWIDQVTRTGETVPEPAPPEPVRQVRWVDPLAAGDLLPDYPLTNQWDQPIHLAQYRGQVLALTFLYTRCPYPNFCPRLAKGFAEVSRRLEARSDLAVPWHLLSVSFDPAHDTPAVLRAFGEQYGYDPARWTLATGAMIEIDALTEQFGLTFGRVGEIIDHNVRTIIVGADGRIRDIVVGNEWEPEEIVSKMLAAGRSAAAP